MDRYLYIKSDDSNSYFTQNQPHQFKVHLTVPLYFSSIWTVGLVEFHADRTKAKKSKDQAGISIFSNFCKDSIVNGSEKPILRRLEMNDRNGWHYIIDSPIYVPVKRTELIEFEVSIKTDDGNFATFLDSPVHLTLHFKRYPFFMDVDSL